MTQKQISRVELASYLLSPALFGMLVLMVAEAMLAAATTWLVINAARKVAVGEFLLTDLILILAAQSASYVAGVISWMFAERAGYRGFGKFMLRFARENRGKVKLFGDKPAREQVEPFLTGETFQCFFNLMYELEFTLKLLLGLVFNAVGAGSRNRPQPAVCLYRRVRRPVADAMGAARTDRAHLSRKPAHEQPHHRAGLYRVGQHLQRQPLQPAALARRLQEPAAPSVDRPDPRHRRARRHERDERHRQSRHRLRHHHRGRREQCRRYRIADRAGDHAAAADRDDLRAASARQRLERFHRHLDAVRRRRRQYAAAARRSLRQSHQIRSTGAARRRPTPTSFPR